MITMKALDGSYAETARVMPEGIDPFPLLHDFLEHKWRWEIDYAHATVEERFTWGRADLVCRLLRTLREGRPVLFLSHSWVATSAEEIAQYTGEIEDAIAQSGRMVSVGYDDARGIAIVARGFEH